MGTKQNVIEINGKKYNAITGKAIGNKGAVKTMDGVSISSSRPRKAHMKAAHNKKTVQKSQTLMRKSVKKPSVKHKSQPTRVAGISKPTLKTPLKRRKKASTTHKSAQISHFGDVQSRSSVVKKLQHMPVKHPKMSNQIQTMHNEPPAIQETQPRQAIAGAATMIENALARATAHEQTVHHKKKRSRVARKLGVSSRAVAISSTVLAGVLLGGFFAVQNIPNLSMRVASARAGFNASLPGYNPSGFSFAGPINYNPGQVTVSYNSNTDDRNYKIIQRASNWNSDALLSNFVVASSQPYQTYQDRGRTLFIYDDSNATWVDNGIWYQIEGKSQMTTDQLVRIASSM